jgi:SAM-dependent methyltransferase
MAVRDLALLFVHAIGIDPSAGMITTARSLGGVSSSNDPIRFEISSAEDLGTDLNPPVQSNTVDLIVAATAAHWFDMPKFWHRAAQVLKPGGTVAIWCSSNAKPKSSTPNFTAVQAAFDLVQDRLDPYMKPGNLLARDMYIGMPLPWDLEVPVFEFDESTYVRKEWNNDGSGEPLDFYADMRPADMDTLEKLFGTMSPVARWREAHPEAVGTEEDIVRMMRREVEAALHEAGTEKGKELIEATVGGVLMMAKKKLSSSN